MSASATILPACESSTGGSYSYDPSLTAGVTFAVLFGLLTIYSSFFILRKHLWFATITIGGFLETLGWIARAASHHDTCNSNLFIMQISVLIFGPVFWSATLYIILGIIITYAPRYSLLKPLHYLYIFSAIDLFSLVLQAIGGGLAASANTQSQANKGAYIMVAGIFVQFVGMTCFVLLGLVFLLRAWRTEVRTHLSASALTIAILATLLIFLRNIYRCVELLEGWNGHLNTTEGFVIGLDGVPMLLCLLSLCVLEKMDRDGHLDRAKHVNLPTKPEVDEESTH